MPRRQGRASRRIWGGGGRWFWSTGVGQARSGPLALRLSGPPSVCRCEPALSLVLAQVSKSPEARSCHWMGRPYIRLLRGRVFLKGRLTRACGGSRPQGLPKLPWSGHPHPHLLLATPLWPSSVRRTWGKAPQGNRAEACAPLRGCAQQRVFVCACMCLHAPVGAWAVWEGAGVSAQMRRVCYPLSRRPPVRGGSARPACFGAGAWYLQSAGSPAVGLGGEAANGRA